MSLCEIVATAAETVAATGTATKRQRLQYVGRIAPSPSGHLHVGHASTFSIACKRAYERNGTMILRVEDLDRARCKPQFLRDMLEDLNWFGITWSLGPQLEDPSIGSEYIQSNRRQIYKSYFLRLLQTGHIYPCKCSRKDVERALSAPNEGECEVIFPPSLRPEYMQVMEYPLKDNSRLPVDLKTMTLEQVDKIRTNWRFRVPDGEAIAFEDNCAGPCRHTAGKDFGDFIVWRSDGYPSYDFACVVDDFDMNVTEVVRGADLLLCTAKQILLYRALGLEERIPQFYHCPLVRDENGKRLAKRDDARSLRQLKDDGMTPEQITQSFQPV